jgi:hypothetical protein
MGALPVSKKDTPLRDLSKNKFAGASSKPPAKARASGVVAKARHSAVVGAESSQDLWMQVCLSHMLVFPPRAPLLRCGSGTAGEWHVIFSLPPCTRTRALTSGTRGWRRRVCKQAPRGQGEASTHLKVSMDHASVFFKHKRVDQTCGNRPPLMV